MDKAAREKARESGSVDEIAESLRQDYEAALQKAHDAPRDGDAWARWSNEAFRAKQRLDAHAGVAVVTKPTDAAESDIAQLQARGAELEAAQSRGVDDVMVERALAAYSRVNCDGVNTRALRTALEAALPVPAQQVGPLCECPECGRMHRHLQAGKPPQKTASEAAQMFDIGNGEFVHFSPNGRFHGWIFRRGSDGQYVSVRQMNAVSDFPPASPFALPAPPVGDR